MTEEIFGRIGLLRVGNHHGEDTAAFGIVIVADVTMMSLNELLCEIKADAQTRSLTVRRCETREEFRLLVVRNPGTGIFHSYHKLVVVLF